MEGYPQLAVLQGKYPQLGIYRRFVTLNARNLLYLQAEIMDLEKRLDEYTLQDLQSNDEERKTYSRNVFFLSLGQGDNKVHNSQWHTMMCIRQKLHQYNEFLIQQRQLLTFDKPGHGNLDFLNHWLADSEHGNHTLEGIDRNVWKEGEDLLVVLPSNLDDSFTRWFRRPVVDYYHSWFGRNFSKPTDIENGLHKYDERSIIRAADLVGTIISATIPIVAVVTLYSIDNMLTRLGLVAVFTIIFSLALVAITKAKRIEIFAATAVFASVQVVFVGSIASEKYGYN